MIKVLNDDNYEAAYSNSESPKSLSIFYFWADWCVPCKTLKPTLAQFNEDRKGLPVFSINVEDSPILAGRFNIRSVPTLILIQSNEIRAMKQGAPTYPSLVRWVQENK